MIFRDNTILKRAVAIQHERQKEFNDKNQEVHQLKQLLVQYQEQLRTLEVKDAASYIIFLASTHYKWTCALFTTITRHQKLCFFTDIFVPLMVSLIQMSCIWGQSFKDNMVKLKIWKDTKYFILRWRDVILKGKDTNRNV